MCRSIVAPHDGAGPLVDGCATIAARSISKLGGSLRSRRRLAPSAGTSHRADASPMPARPRGTNGAPIHQFRLIDMSSPRYADVHGARGADPGGRLGATSRAATRRTSGPLATAGGARAQRPGGGGVDGAARRATEPGLVSPRSAASGRARVRTSQLGGSARHLLPHRPRSLRGTAPRGRRCPPSGPATRAGAGKAERRRRAVATHAAGPVPLHREQRPVTDRRSAPARAVRRAPSKRRALAATQSHFTPTRYE